MKQLSKIQKLYRDIKKNYKEILRFNPFEKYDMSNFFYLIDEVSHNLGIFCDVMIHNNPGLQLFIGRDGLSYLCDVLYNHETYALDKSFSNVIGLSFVPKSDLDKRDKEFLKKMGSKASENNFIIYSMKEGFDDVYPNEKDLVEVFYLTKYILCLFYNDEKALNDIFECGNMCQAIFNNDNMTYNVRGIIDFEYDTLPKKKKAHEGFVNEILSKCNYISEKCYIGRLYLPIREENKKHFHSVVFIYLSKEDILLYNIYSCKPKSITDYVYSFLDEVFVKYGIFDEIVISDRTIYSGICKTLKNMKIDVKFERKDNDFSIRCYSEMINVLTDFAKIPKDDFIDMLENSDEEIEKMLNSINDYYGSDYEDDVNDDSISLDSLDDDDFNLIA